MYRITDPIKALIWRVCFEYVNDFKVGDKERIVGTLKPTRFARMIDRICIGK
jgi:hypothetical protein